MNLSLSGFAPSRQQGIGYSRIMAKKESWPALASHWGFFALVLPFCASESMETFGLEMYDMHVHKKEQALKSRTVSTGNEKRLKKSVLSGKREKRMMKLDMFSFSL